MTKSKLTPLQAFLLVGKVLLVILFGLIGFFIYPALFFFIELVLGIPLPDVMFFMAIFPVIHVVLFLVGISLGVQVFFPKKD